MSFKSLKFDQYTAMGILVLSLIYAYLGSLTPIGFYNGTIGPHHWLYILAFLLAVLSLILWFTPTDLLLTNEAHAPKDWLTRIPFIIGIFSLCRGTSLYRVFTPL